MNINIDLLPRYKRTWAEIDLSNAEYNYRQVKSNTQAKICCVVKANAYGHGAIEMALLYQKLGADYLAVSNIDEALQLRSNQIHIPILILGYTSPECVIDLIENNITQTVYSLEYAKSLLKYLQLVDSALKIHIKIDSGMGRLGFQCNDIEVGRISEICQNPHIIAEGIFTHFSVSDSGRQGNTYTKQQFQTFVNLINKLEKENISFSIKHCCNSAAIFDYPQYHMDMVRAGIVLYGLKPSLHTINAPQLKSVMTLKSLISHIKTVPSGSAISYGKTYISPCEMKIATIPIGYADGLSRYCGEMHYSLKVHDQYTPILGRICMDQLMLDVTNIDVNIGDEVLVFGNDDVCTADRIAQITNTINYEVICSIRERVNRLFVSSNE